MSVVPRNRLRIGVRGLPSWSTLTVAAALLVFASNAGCDSCQRDRPYTPFRVDPTVVPSIAPPAESTAPAASAPPAGSVDVVVEGRKLEPPLGRFEVGARTIELPKDLVAARVLERSAGDQQDALVWVVPAKADIEWNGPMGELWWFPAGGDSKKVFSLPGWLPSGPGCSHEPRLVQVTKEAAFVDVVARCSRSLPQRTPTRVVGMFALGKIPTFVLGLRIAEPAPDEVLTLSPLSTDRDGDGREDPSVRIDLEVATTKAQASAAIGWLDRAAGASMDESHFEASIEPSLKRWEANLAKKPKLAGMLVEIAALRRLLNSLCQQSATPRMFDWRGDALRCPGLARVAVRLARLEVKAALGLSDVLEAAHALAYATTWQGGIPAVEREDLRKRIEKSVTKVAVGLPAAATLRPAVSADPVRFSPLSFEGLGTSLLVQLERGGLTRLALDGTTTPLDPDGGVAAWTLALTGPDGRRWTNVVPACDRSELSLAVKGADGQFLPLQPTRLLAPRPGPCRNPTAWPVNTAPIRWEGDGPIAIIDGVCWTPTGTQACAAPHLLGAVAPGTPRSPDGRRLVVATSLGPMVLGGTKTELWTGAALDGKRLTDCVVADDAKAIACVADGNVVLVGRPEAAAVTN